ncbi:MAG: hypothetical protein C5B43_02835 [Verrucomicrobia bacterium]|nr:MAG: hypothetical protein C5B43_02835 [Verrucomicrobiota bacterium]
MDKKNIILGLALLGGAFAVMFWQGKQYDIIEPVQKKEVSELPAELRPEAVSDLTGKTGEKSSGLFEVVTPVTMEQGEAKTEKVYTLENEALIVRFTDQGGGIKDVALKKYPLTQESDAPFVFNAFSPAPALGLGFQDAQGVFKNYAPSYELVSQTKDKILFSAKTPEGVKILRGYKLDMTEKEGDPYVIHHETRFVNNSNEALNLKKLLVSMGSMPPTKGDTFGEYLNVGYYNGKDAEFIKVGQFKGSKGFLGFGRRDSVDLIKETVNNIQWGSVKNQFFATVLTPDEPAVAIVAAPVDVGMASGDKDLNEGMTGSLEMQLGVIAPSQERLLSLDYYVGPKEFTRLDKLGKKQDLVMQFGFFGIISKFLLLIMTAIHSVVPNWGVTIIIVTIIIKLILWPLTAVQVKSSKRMATIQAPLKALKEKYKNNPQKLQMETMKLFKANKVNPAAGCLPLLVQLPIFLGLYFMLRTSSELRYAPFLWINDLSVPDTVGFIMGFPINILPLLMAASMFFQMKMTPSPMTDNAQKKIFQLMPFIFLVFCYNFPSGLVLYWTVQNLLTIVQSWITNRMKDPELVPVEVEASKGKGSGHLKTKMKKSK